MTGFIRATVTSQEAYGVRSQSFDIDTPSFFLLFSSSMVHKCTAAGCSNTNRNGVSLFCFPKDAELRKKWICQVRRTRAAWAGPTTHSRLCSNHFDEDCFEKEKDFREKLGLERKRIVLLPGSIPTIFKRSADASGKQSPKKRRSAYAKRESARMLHEMMAASHQAVGKYLSFCNFFPNTYLCTKTTTTTTTTQDIGLIVTKRDSKL